MKMIVYVISYAVICIIAILLAIALEVIRRRNKELTLKNGELKFELYKYEHLHSYQLKQICPNEYYGKLRAEQELSDRVKPYIKWHIENCYTSEDKAKYGDTKLVAIIEVLQRDIERWK